MSPPRGVLSAQFGPTGAPSARLDSLPSFPVSTEGKDVLTVDDYGAIRRAHRDGMSIRRIARDLGHSRRKIRQVLSEPQPAPYTRTRPPQAPVLGPFHAIIDQILGSDQQASPKQRHTAMQVFRRLRDEHGYRG